MPASTRFVAAVAVLPGFSLAHGDCTNAAYDQCGGLDNAGHYSHCCPANTVCVAVSEWWSQCQPIDGAYVHPPTADHSHGSSWSAHGDLGGVTDPLAWGRMVNGHYQLWHETAPTHHNAGWAPEETTAAPAGWAPEAPTTAAPSGWAPEVESGDGGDGGDGDAHHGSWHAHADLSHVNDPLAWGRFVNGEYKLWSDTQAGAGNSDGWAAFDDEVVAHPYDAVPAAWAAVANPHAPVVYAPAATWAVQHNKLSKRERKQAKKAAKAESKAAKRAEKKAAKQAKHSQGWAAPVAQPKPKPQGWAAPVAQPEGWAYDQDNAWAGSWTAAPVEESQWAAPTTAAPVVENNWAAPTTAAPVVENNWSEPATTAAPVVENNWSAPAEVPTHDHSQWAADHHHHGDGAHPHHEYDQGLANAEQWAWGTVNEDGTYSNWASVGTEMPEAGWGVNV